MKYVSTDAACPQVADADDVVSSRGVCTADFLDVSANGKADKSAFVPDAVGNGGSGFRRDGLNTRRVGPKNSPTAIKAVHNFRDFCGGRGSHTFNGGEVKLSPFFSLALQRYQATRVPNDAPFDRFAEGNTAALTAQQQNGLAVLRDQRRCVGRHGGAEFINASLSHVTRERLEMMPMGTSITATHDAGFYDIGVSPTTDDTGVGGIDPFGNLRSETRMLQAGKAAMPGHGFPRQSIQRSATRSGLPSTAPLKRRPCAMSS